MKNFLFALFIIASSYQANAQLIGNSVHDAPGNLAVGYTTYWRIETGPSDAGEFTHIGMYIDPSNFCDQFTMAIFSSHVSPIKPKDLLGTVGYNLNIIDGEYNEFPLFSNVTLAPSTYYYIAIKGDAQINGGRENGVNWPYPTWYYASWFFGGFVDPAPSSLSAVSNPNNHAIYVIANSSGLLPITLSYFNATSKNNKVTLDWETTNEINNDGWNIQKTTNGFTYETIAWVDGQGNSSSINNYEFIDSYPSNGNNIYRLEQVDLDGHKSYSDHRSVQIENRETSFFPNPVKDIMQIKGEIYAPIKILDANGQLVLEQSFVDNKIDLSQLVNGYYFVELNNIKHPFIKVD